MYKRNETRKIKVRNVEIGGCNKVVIQSMTNTKTKDVKSKVNQIIALLVPMFVISFKRADELSNAMEARGYVIGAPRTKIDDLKFRFIDFFCLFVVIGLFVAVILHMVGVY